MTILGCLCISFGENQAIRSWGKGSIENGLMWVFEGFWNLNSREFWLGDFWKCLGNKIWNVFGNFLKLNLNVFEMSLIVLKYFWKQLDGLLNGFWNNSRDFGMFENLIGDFKNGVWIGIGIFWTCSWKVF